MGGALVDVKWYILAWVSLVSATVLASLLSKFWKPILSDTVVPPTLPTSNVKFRTIQPLLLSLFEIHLASKVHQEIELFRVVIWKIDGWRTWMDLSVGNAEEVQSTKLHLWWQYWHNLRQQSELVSRMKTFPDIRGVTKFLWARVSFENENENSFICLDLCLSKWHHNVPVGYVVYLFGDGVNRRASAAEQLMALMSLSLYTLYSWWGLCLGKASVHLGAWLRTQGTNT